MKSFVVVYTQTVRKDQLIQAKSEKEALKLFQAARPEVKVVDVQTWNEGISNYE